MIAGRHIRRLFAACLFVVGSISAAVAEPAFWRVSDEDSSVYIFGSIHLFTRQIDWRTAAFDDQLRDAEHVYFEVIIDGNVLGAIAGAIIKEGPLKNGRKLSDLMTKEQYAKVQAALAQAKMSEAIFEKARPWIVEYFLINAGFAGATPGVELSVIGEVDPDRLRAFETAEEQMRFFSGASESDQVTSLLASIDEMETSKQVVEDTMKAWESGDLDAVIGLTANLDEQRYRTLLSDRNERWVESIDTMLAENDDALVIVGLAHLAGDGGVPALLAQRGFTVERLQ